MLSKFFLAAALVVATVDLAWADCAWVLWSRFYLHADAMNVTRDQWEVTDTAGSRDACVRMLSERAARKSDELTMDERGDSYFVVTPKKRSGVTSYLRFECLPDSVDPRGPKAK